MTTVRTYVRTYVRTHVRTYVRTHVCTYVVSINHFYHDTDAEIKLVQDHLNELKVVQTNSGSARTYVVRST